MFIFNLSKRVAIVFFAMSGVVFANETSVQTPNGVISGNIGVVSKYIYRGGVESDDLAAQGGIEYAHKSGIKVGYWGSTLDYNPAHEDKNFGFENDLYIAYGHEINQNWSYNLQATAYIYHNTNNIVADNGDKRPVTSYDLTASLIYKNLTLLSAVTLADSSASNIGDTYLSAMYSYALPQDFSLNTSIGATAYNSSHDDEVVQTQKDFAFNEARIGVSKHFANTGLVASVDYVIGGEDRSGEDFDDHVVFGLNYNF